MQAETIMSHWELWGACTSCNPQRANVIIYEFCFTHVAGATCFEDLRTTHQPHTPTTIVHPTFKSTCLARGLLQDDAEWDQCLSETAGVQLPRSLQQLFASLLIYNNITNPRRLWDKHKGALTEDFLHQARQVSGQKASTKEASLPFIGL